MFIIIVYVLLKMEVCEVQWRNREKPVFHIIASEVLFERIFLKSTFINLCN